MLKCPPNLGTIDIDLIYSVPFLPQKRFVNLQLKITYFGHFWTLNFRKLFFGLKKRKFKWVYRPQNLIFHHFFTCSKYPYYHMFISQKIILVEKYLVFFAFFEISQIQNTEYF